MTPKDVPVYDTGQQHSSNKCCNVRKILLRGCITPVIFRVPNQRKKSKRVLSIPMDETLLAGLEAEAGRLGVNRVSLINQILRERLESVGKLPPREDGSGK